jgi:predicted nucleotide-binding protein (sugar kinase/HSP70/actin superfamily)
MLLMDEHTGEAGLITRVESFVDVLRLRNRGK